MKRVLFVLPLVMLSLSGWSQIGITTPDTVQESVVYVDDEACGCELVFIDGIQTTTDGEHYGFKRQDGSIIADNIYYYVDRFHGNYCKVLLSPDSTGMIDREGNEVVPCIYSDVEYPSEGRFRVQKGICYGFCNLHGHEVIPPTYRAASVYQEGLAVVAYDFDSFHMEYGFIDTLGNIALSPRYEYAFPFCEGFSVVKMFERYGMIDKQGNEVVPAKYETITSMSNGIYFAGDDKTVALYNRRHERLTDQVYESILGMTDGRILVRRNNKYGFLDTQGREVIPCRYQEANLFHEGCAMVAESSRYGIIDTLGNIILPIEFSNSGYRFEAYQYHEGLALIEWNGKYGFVNRQGKLVVPPQYMSAYQFAYGLAPVQSASTGLWGYINTSGQLVIPHLFSTASPYRYGRAEVSDLQGLHHIDTEGRCVKNCQNSPKSWKK